MCGNAPGAFGFSAAAASGSGVPHQGGAMSAEALATGPSASPTSASKSDFRNIPTRIDRARDGTRSSQAAGSGELLHPQDRPLDVRFGGARVDRAHAQRHPAADLG